MRPGKVFSARPLMSLCPHDGGWEASVTCPFTVPWARAQGRGRECMPFPFFPNTRVTSSTLRYCWSHQVPEVKPSPPSLTTWLAAKIETELGLTEVGAEDDKFCKSLKFIMSHPEPIMYTPPPDLLQNPHLSSTHHLVLQMRNPVLSTPPSPSGPHPPSPLGLEIPFSKHL